MRVVELDCHLVGQDGPAPAPVLPEPNQDVLYRRFIAME
jgi:hypothetical protein